MTNQPTSFYAVGCACLGAVGGILFSIAVTLAYPTVLGPPWLRSIGLSALEIEIVLMGAFLATAVIAFGEDELARYEGDSREARS